MKNKTTNLKYSKKYFLLAFLFCFAFTANAKIKTSVKADPALTANVNKWMQNSSNLRFLENKGQMADMNHKTDSDLLFEVSGKGMDVYITTKGISYVFTDVEKHKKKNLLKNKMGMNSKFNFMNDSITLKYCRADMNLVGATISKENILKEGESEDYDNYYLSQCPQGVLNVRSYKKITIKNIYPGIDWVLFTNATSGIKYNFVIHPGADASQLKLQYKWTDNPELQSDGSININTPMSKITEGTPLSYTDENEQNKIETNYIIKNNEISFAISNYNKHKILIIDPVLVWATYYGGNVGTEPMGIQSDGTNVYVTGYETSIGFPTFDPGAGAYFQGTLGGSSINPFVLQFSTSGVRKWATYYGGSNGDYGLSIYSDGASVWVTGATSSTDFPTFNPGGAYFQGTLAGSQNAFILQFSTSGVRKWATYYGGSNGDAGYSISSDGANVWVTGQTTSIDFPTFNPGGGVYFQGTGNVTGEAFILQFSTSGVRKWATYYGGSYGDIGYSISSDGTNVWVTGETGSTNFPTFNPGAGAYFQGALGGNSNAFILQFNTSGVRKWATYYGGSGFSLGNYGTSVSSDGTNVWVTGATISTNFPTFNPGGGAYFQGTGNANGTAFILQFTISDVRKWATYYGGSGSYGDIGYSISSDGANVWVTGSTNSTDFPTLNMGCNSYFQGTMTSGDQDVFILQFSNTGVRKWATFYGEDQENDGSYVSSDGVNVWLTADAANSTGYPTISPGGGAYFENTCAGIDNLLIAQFTISSGIKIIASPDSICLGDSSILKVSGGNNYSWHPSTGLIIVNDSIVIVKPITNTVYTVVGTNSCGDIDSAKVTVYIINPPPIKVISSPDTICLGDSNILKASGGSNYSWHPNTGLIIVNDSIVIVKPITNTVYTVVGTNACGNIDSAKVNVYVKDCATPPTLGQIQIPNIITPNNDGKNDAFFITNLPAQCKLKIFNRWGNTVYQSLNYQNNWEASDVVSGTYYYLLTLPDGTIKKGFLEVIK